MVVTDRGVAGTEGFGQLVRLLNDARLEPLVFDSVEPEPVADTIDEGVRVFQEGGYDAVVGVGGGSAMDAGKGIAMVAANKGSITNYYGLNKCAITPFPMIAVPTTAGTGSEVTPGAVLVNTKTDKKMIAFLFPHKKSDAALATFAVPADSIEKITGFAYEKQHRIGRFVVDTFVPIANLIIEWDGDYWHGNNERGSMAAIPR